MVGRYAAGDIRVFAQQTQVTLFVREKYEFLGAALSYGEKPFGQQPAECTPVRMRFIKTMQILVSNKENISILHGFNKIPAWVARDKTPERNDELVLRKKEDIFFFPALRSAVINAKDPFDHQSQVIAHQLLHIKEISFLHPARFPECPAGPDVFVGQGRKFF